MKRLLLLVFAVLIFSLAAFGQGNTVTLSFPGAPTGSCAFIMFAVRADTGALYDCLSGSWHLISGSGTVTGTGTTGYIPKWSSATAIGNSLCDEGITTANFLTCGDTSGIAAAGFTGTGSTAGYMALINGTSNSIPANSLRIQAPATITTGFGWTLPSAENASAGFLKIGAASSHESTLTIAALTQAEIPAPLLTLGTSRSIANGAEIVVCTTTCTVTPIIPTSPFGQEFCVFNGDNVSTVITLAALTGVQYEVTARTSYGTANHTKTSGGAVKDMICMVAIDATHYIATNFIGIWTDN